MSAASGCSLCNAERGNEIEFKALEILCVLILVPEELRCVDGGRQVDLGLESGCQFFTCGETLMLRPRPETPWALPACRPQLFLWRYYFSEVERHLIAIIVKENQSVRNRFPAKNRDRRCRNRVSAR